MADKVIYYTEKRLKDGEDQETDVDVNLAIVDSAYEASMLERYARIYPNVASKEPATFTVTFSAGSHMAFTGIHGLLPGNKVIPGNKISFGMVADEGQEVGAAWNGGTLIEKVNGVYVTTIEGNSTIISATLANTYAYSFYVDDELYKAVLFCANNIEDQVMPAVPEKEGYTGKWVETVEGTEVDVTNFTLESKIINAKYTESP